MSFPFRFCLQGVFPEPRVGLARTNPVTRSRNRQTRPRLAGGQPLRDDPEPALPDRELRVRPIFLSVPQSAGQSVKLMGLINSPCRHLKGAGHVFVILPAGNRLSFVRTRHDDHHRHLRQRISAAQGLPEKQTFLRLLQKTQAFQEPGAYFLKRWSLFPQRAPHPVARNKKQ